MAHTYNKGALLRFGKYIGTAIEEVIEQDPNYIHWALNNIKGFAISVPMTRLLAESLNQLRQDEEDEANDAMYYDHIQD